MMDPEEEQAADEPQGNEADATEEEAIISNDEMEALLEGVESGELAASEGVQAGEAVSVDLVTQSLGKVRLPALSRANDRYSQVLRSTLYDMVQKPAEVSFKSLDSVKLGDFLQNQPTPTAFGIFNFTQLSGMGMLAVGPQLLFCIVSTFFGGEGEQKRSEDKIEFSATETRVAQGFIRQALRDLEGAWEEMLEVKAVPTGFESNPAMALITDKTDSIIVSNFHAEIEGIGGGEFCLALPKAMIEPVIDELSAESRADRPNENPLWQRAMRQQLLEVPTQSRAVLATLPTSVREVARLRVGDVLPIDDPNSVILNLEGVPFRHASYGETRGKAAVRLGKVCAVEAETKKSLDEAMRTGALPADNAELG
ncbi:MAG: flagellar motor switch protein FliM [Granulosicoccaceae bacterium]